MSLTRTTITITPEALDLLPPGRSMSARINDAIVRAARSVEPYPAYEADGLQVWRVRVEEDGVSRTKVRVVATATSVHLAASLAAHLEATGFNPIEARVAVPPRRKE